jgi:hypothetical protein
MSLKFKDKINSTTFDNLIVEEDENVIYELSCLTFTSKNEVVQVLVSFLSFKKKNEKKMSHNMFFLMLNPRCKTFLFVSSFIDHEQGKLIVEEYDKNFLFSMFFKCHYHLQVFAESKRGVVDQRVEKDNNMDIFEMIASTSELATKSINRMLFIFRHYQVDVKNIKCPLQW